MSKLYELTEAFTELDSRLSDREMDEEERWSCINDTLEAITGVSLEQKVENVIRAIKNLEAESDMFSTEAKRLAEEGKKRARDAARLKEYMRNELSRLGRDSLSAGLFKVTFRNSQKALETTSNLEELPDWVQERFVKTEKNLDKRGLVKHLKDHPHLQNEKIRLIDGKKAMVIK